jgi:hypothetical protein
VRHLGACVHRKLLLLRDCGYYYFQAKPRFNNACRILGVPRVSKHKLEASCGLKYQGVKAKTSPTSREILNGISEQEAKWVRARTKEAMQIAGQGRAAV